MTIPQLGMYTVGVEHRNNNKKCKFFVVPGNGQVILGMSDTDVLNILKININLIGAEDARDSDKQCVNTHTVQGSEPKQETDRAEKYSRNMDSISKLRGNTTKPKVKTMSNKTAELPIQVTRKVYMTNTYRL